MKAVVELSLARDREGGAFCAAHVTRRRPAGADSFFTSLRKTPRPPDQVALLLFDGRKAKAHPAKDGGCPDPVSKGGGAGAARDGGHGRRRIPAVLGAPHPPPVNKAFHASRSAQSMVEQLKWY